jgi:hypothetical protein
LLGRHPTTASIVKRQTNADSQAGSSRARQSEQLSPTPEIVLGISAATHGLFLNRAAYKGGFLIPSHYV